MARGQGEPACLARRPAARAAATAHLLIDAQHVLQQGTVDLLSLPLRLDQLEHGAARCLLDLRVHIVCGGGRDGARLTQGPRTKQRTGGCRQKQPLPKRSGPCAGCFRTSVGSAWAEDGMHYPPCAPRAPAPLTPEH